MEDQFTQLRFDISEKVRLHPQQPGIDTLLELDLYPDVEIKDEGQHLKIQGYLRLNGVYVGEEQTAEEESGALHNRRVEEETNELAYVIPVEITLPADRAEQSRISAEVETFDYEVLSPFELKIEAILMIDGLLPESSHEEEEQSGENVQKYPVFSGSTAQPLTIAGEDGNKEAAEKEEDPSEAVAQRQAQEEEPARETGERKAEDVREEKAKEEVKETKEVSEPALHELAQPEKEPEEKESKEVVQEIKLSPKDFWYERQKSKQMELKPEEDLIPAETAEEEHPVQEKVEVPKQEDDTPEPVLAEEEGTVEEEGTTEDSADGEERDESGEARSKAEWIRWLVHGKEEHFVPIKMVIVQEDETIDQVAGKYEVSADEIVNKNRLTTDRLEPGQILQVPVKPTESHEKREA
jgi:stage VI sporulation protein D